MKKISMLLILCCVFGIASAQQKDLTYFNYKGDDINGFLTKRVRYPRAVLDTGAMPFTYVKFKINDGNEVDSIIVTNDHYPELKAELTKDLKLTNGYWNLAVVKDKWFTLAFDFSIVFVHPQKGIDYRKIVEDKVEQQAPEYRAKPSVKLPTIFVIAYAMNRSIE